MKVTRRFRFSSCHYLFNRTWTEEKNYRLFGKSVHPHGHNFEVFVTVEGKVNPETGMVINLEDLKSIVTPVIEELDHRCLNDLDYFKDTLPTLENIAIYIFKRLSSQLKNLTSVIVKTGENEFVEYTGEESLNGFSQRISASHRLPEERVSGEDVYGKCGKEKHGHDYEITVWLKGERNFDKIREVLRELDHRDLDEILPLPTGEHLAMYIARRLGEKFRVKKIKVQETENNSFELEL